jgi:hypothetical protein
MTDMKQWVRLHVVEELSVPNQKSETLYPQAVLQLQPQCPRIDLGPDHGPHRAHQGRYAELFELQICVSHKLDIWGRDWK